MSDDHSHDFIRGAASQIVRDGCLWRRITDQATDVGFDSTPNNPCASREAYPYGANGVEIGAIYA